MNDLTVLGTSGVGAQDKLEAFKTEPFYNRSTVADFVVTFTVEEFTSLCPVTNQPDFGTITIKYAPNHLCLESKSLKLYLQTLREKGIFWETLAHEIADKLNTFLQPFWIEVTTNQNARGGIGLSTTVLIEEGLVK